MFVINQFIKILKQIIYFLIFEICQNKILISKMMQSPTSIGDPQWFFKKGFQDG